MEVQANSLVAEPSADLKPSCRLCGSPSLTVVKIFNEAGLCNDLGNNINLYLPVKVLIDDGLPEQCCWNCANTVMSWHNFYLSCQKTEEKLQVLKKSSEEEILQKESLQQADEVPETLEPSKQTKVEEVCIVSSDEEGTAEKITLESLLDEEEAVKFTNDQLLLESRLADSTFKCNVCGRVCKTSQAFIEHFRLHSRGFNCPFCKQKCKRLIDLKLHLKYSHSRPNLRFNMERQYSALTNSFRCVICGKGFITKAFLELHKMVHQKSKGQDNHHVCESNKPQEDNQPLFKTQFYQIIQRARTCEEALEYLRQGKSHAAEHRCEYCSQVFLTSASLQSHINIKHFQIKSHFCTVCNKGFCTKKALENHQKEHLSNSVFHKEPGWNGLVPIKGQRMYNKINKKVQKTGKDSSVVVLSIDSD